MPVNRQNLSQAINAALNGPERRDVRIANYRFNIKPARIEQSGGRGVLSGDDDNYNSRRRRARPNDRVYYASEKDAAGIQDLEIDVDRGGMRAVANRHGAELVDLIRTIGTQDISGGARWLQQARQFGTQGRSGGGRGTVEVPDEALRILDDSWESEAAFLVTMIALEAEIQ